MTDGSRGSLGIEIHAAGAKKLTLVNRLAVGGMGEVYLAKQEGPAGFTKTVAVKRILDGLSEKQEFVEMFLDEARLAARLSHPNIVQVYDLGTSNNEGAYFMTMEFIDGRSLQVLKRASRAKGKGLPPELVAYICQLALRGLHYAHRLNDDNGRPLSIVHRDVTPENILLGFNGVVKLVDFGIAKASLNQTVTQAQMLKGKIQYIAPELLRGGDASVHSDIYSMGVLLYEVLTGVFPFPGGSPAEIVQAALQKTATHPCELNGNLPVQLGEIIVRAMSKNPNERFENAAALAAELGSFLEEVGARIDEGHLAAFMATMFHGKRRKGDMDTESERGLEPPILSSPDLAANMPAAGSPPQPNPRRRSADDLARRGRGWILGRLKNAWKKDPSAMPKLVAAPGQDVAHVQGFGQLLALGTNEALPLPSGNVTIGRDATNDVVIDSAQMPNTAARLRKTEEGHWEITALSHNGTTRVNGTPCAQAIVAPGDVLQVGGIDFVFHSAVGDFSSAELSDSALPVLSQPMAIEDIRGPYDANDGDDSGPRLVREGDEMVSAVLLPEGDVDGEAVSLPGAEGEPAPALADGAVDAAPAMWPGIRPSGEREDPTLHITLGWPQLIDESVRLARQHMVVVPKTEMKFAHGETREVQAFLLDRNPVTNAEYFQYIEATGDLPPAHWRGRRFASGEADRPVVGVSLDMARAYSKWRGVRLPTSLEWECAARGPDGTAFPWGNEYDPEKCHGPERQSGHTVDVGSVRGTEALHGLHDMVGNVWEWTEVDPASSDIPEPGYAWVFGGSYLHGCSDDGQIPRRSVLGEKDYLYLGFRCAADLT